MRNSHGYLTVRYVTHDQSSYNIAASRTSSNNENMGRDLDDSSLYHVLDEVPIECITPISFIAAKRLGVVCVDDNDSHMAKLFINETQSRNQESIPGKEITIARDSDGCDYYNVQLSSLLVLLNEAYIYSDALTIDNILSDYPMGVYCALCSSVINPMDEVNAVPVWFKDRARVVKIGDGGEEILFLRKSKVFRTAYARKMGKNTYWFAVGQDGYWYNFLLGDLDAKMGMLDIEPIDRDMRYMHVAIRKNIQERYRKETFMQKYGTIMINGIFLIIMIIALWLMLDQIGELIEQAATATSAGAKTLEVVTNALARVDFNMCWRFWYFSCLKWLV